MTHNEVSDGEREAYMKRSTSEATLRIFLFFFFYIGTVMAFTLGEACALSIFVNRIGVQYLPYMLGLAPVGIIGVMILFGLIVDRLDRVKVLAVILIVSIAFLSLAAIFEVRSSWFSAMLLFYVEAVGFFISVQFFTLLNDAFTTREAQRSVPLITIGWFIGSGIAGIAAGTLAKLLHTQNLLLICASLYGIVFGILIGIRIRMHDRLRVRRRSKKATGIHASASAAIRGLKIFQILMVSTLLMWVIYTAMFYQFSDVGHRGYPTEDDFTTYVGAMTLVCSAIGLVIQLMATTRVVSYLGLGASIALMPLVAVIGGIALSVKASLATSFASYLAVVLMKNTIFVAAFQLYFNQVAKAVRGGLRNLVEGVMSPVGAFLAGVLLLVLGLFLKGEPFIRTLALIVSAVAAAWFVIALRSERHYKDLLYANTLSDDFELKINTIEALQRRGGASAARRVEQDAGDPTLDLRRRCTLGAMSIYVKGGEEMIPKSRIEHHTLKIIHGTEDTPRYPEKVCAEHDVILTVASFPKNKGAASMWAQCDVTDVHGRKEERRADGAWLCNERGYSLWNVKLGSFRDGDEVRYVLNLKGDMGNIACSGEYGFHVGPHMYLNIVLHMSANALKDYDEGSYLSDIIRLNAVCYYYEVLYDLYASFGHVHLTINLTPVMLETLVGYAKGVAIDRALKIMRKRVDDLTDDEKHYILKHCFNVQATSQIREMPCFKRLWERRDAEGSFSRQDFLDLMACYNLSWFPALFRGSEDRVLESGDVMNMSKLFEKGSDYTEEDICCIADAQVKIIRSVVVIMKKLKQRGQVEFSISPYFHPNMPLICDSDCAGTKNLPAQFAYPQDVKGQIDLAIEIFQQLFGEPPHGIWPPDAALSADVVALLDDGRFAWVASDVRLLARSNGGYNISNPNTNAVTYRIGKNHPLVCFFAEPRLLTDFQNLYVQYMGKYDEAEHFLNAIKYGYMHRLAPGRGKVLTMVVDSIEAVRLLGHDIVAVFRDIFRRIDLESEVEMVTPWEYISGNVDRGIPAHAPSSLEHIEQIACGSWKYEDDRMNIGFTAWIGRQRTNCAWELLRMTRAALEESGATNQTHPDAYMAMYNAESSFWFRWYDDPDECPTKEDFDATFRSILKYVYRSIGQDAPKILDTRIIPGEPYWDFERRIDYIEGNMTLTVQAPRPGHLRWGVNDWDGVQDLELMPEFAEEGFKVSAYRARIDVTDENISEINFTFVWEDGCEHDEDFRILVDWGYERMMKSVPTREERFF